MSEIMMRKWDPRLGEDYVLVDHVTKRVFSSLQSGHFVIELLGNINWKGKAEVIKALCGKAIGSIFFSVTPWNASVTKVVRAIDGNAVIVSQYAPDIFGAINGFNAIETLLGAREASGGKNSGEWRLGVGSVLFPEASSTASSKNLSFFLDNAAEIDFLLDLSEMEQALLLVRPDKGVDTILDQLILSGS